MNTRRPAPRRLARIVGALAAALTLVALPGCEEKLSQEAFDEIKVGMTMSEVEAILHGSGTEDVAGGYGTTSGGLISGSTSQGTDEKFYVWTEKNRKVIIRLRDGKVAHARKEGF